MSIYHMGNSEGFKLLKEVFDIDDFDSVVVDPEIKIAKKFLELSKRLAIVEEAVVLLCKLHPNE